MDQIQITYQKMPVGFGKPTTEKLDGVIFDNGKVAYLDSEGTVLASDSQESLEKALTAHGKDVEIAKVRRAKKA